MAEKTADKRDAEKTAKVLSQNGDAQKSEPQKGEPQKSEPQKSETVEFGKISTSEDLKGFLRNVLDKMSDDQAAPVYSLAVMNHLLNLPDIYTLLDNENKELARDIWLRLKASGVQLRNPPLLFGAENEGTAP